MSRLTRALPLPSLLVVVLASVLIAAPSAIAQSPDGVVERAVSFAVTNSNRTSIACQTDGATYQVRGHLSGPASALSSPDAVMLVLHGLSYGEFFSTFDAKPGYDFAREQAEAGFVTVTVDRLGYDSSDDPPGPAICFGSRADIAHQIVQQLRTGAYTSETGDAPVFPRVVLAGHSVGAIIAQNEAFTFADVDALVVLSYSDRTLSPTAQQALATVTTDCAAGGQPSEDGAPGYVAFGSATAEQCVAAHFAVDVADPAVVAATAEMRDLDPCGDIDSYRAAVANDLAHLPEIGVPVLVVTGGGDAVTPTGGVPTGGGWAATGGHHGRVTWLAPVALIAVGLGELCVSLTWSRRARRDELVSR